MVGSLLSLARSHTKTILESGGFETDVTFTTPPGATTIETATVKCLAIKHHTSIDSDGVPVSSQHAHVTVHEESLTDKNYTTRNASGKIDLKNHIIDFADSSGVSRKYIVDDVLPDNTLGCIPLILGNFKQNG